MDVAVREAAASSPYGFMAASRALIEACSDTIESLGAVPVTLAEHFAMIARCLDGHEASPVESQELQDALIHFTHGRRLSKDEVAPASHRAKQAAEYVKRAEAASPGVQDLYDDCCSMIHPAAASVLSLFKMKSQSSQHFEFGYDLSFARGILEELCAKHSAVFPKLLQMGYNPGLLTLGVINRFGVFPRVRGLNDLAGIGGWKCVDDALRRAVIPKRAGNGTRFGRNERCFCGSGQKYKKCHGR
ncbi:MAG: SEC-C metal-binding domain-containing protein [Vulcanimicrobiaceae bacterium]